MKPKINVLEMVDGVLQPVTREMTEEEYAEYEKMLQQAEREESQWENMQAR